MKRALPWLLNAPALLVLGIFAISMLSFVGISFLTQEPGGATFSGPVTLGNYADAIGSAYVRRVALETFMLAVKVTVLTVALG